jgi:2-polyprenyl-3-methyl-5-hydroxy-6-metoxy-1,4-benzoquinol methylase
MEEQRRDNLPLAGNPKIQEAVVGMYSEHPWPLNREADEEMGWRLKCLGVVPDDYRGRRVLDMGCGTGEYALWYALNGAESVTGIDLADGSLAIARQRRSASGASPDFSQGIAGIGLEPRLRGQR